MAVDAHCSPKIVKICVACALPWPRPPKHNTQVEQISITLLCKNTAQNGALSRMRKLTVGSGNSETEQSRLAKCFDGFGWERALLISGDGVLANDLTHLFGDRDNINWIQTNNTETNSMPLEKQSAAWYGVKREIRATAVMQRLKTLEMHYLSFLLPLLCCSAQNTCESQ